MTSYNKLREGCLSGRTEIREKLEEARERSVLMQRLHAQHQQAQTAIGKRRNTLKNVYLSGRFTKGGGKQPSMQYSHIMSLNNNVSSNDAAEFLDKYMMTSNPINQEQLSIYDATYTVNQNLQGFCQKKKNYEL